MLEAAIQPLELATGQYLKIDHFNTWLTLGSE